MQRYPMTVQGAEALKKELEELKTVQRPRVIEAIAEARAHGDLKENAEYHAAREQQGFIEARIKALEAKLAHAQVIDVTKVPCTGKVVFGVTVELEHLDAGMQVTYQIVSEDEANLAEGKISITSPIARGLVGKEEGDEVRIQTPNGLVAYEIVAVKHL